MSLGVRIKGAAPVRRIVASLTFASWKHVCPFAAPDPGTPAGCLSPGCRPWRGLDTTAGPASPLESKDDDHKAAYDGLEEEFRLARALIEARTAAGLLQAQLANRMRTSQSSIASKVRQYARQPMRWSASFKRPAHGFGLSSSLRSFDGLAPQRRGLGLRARGGRHGHATSARRAAGSTGSN